MHNCPVCGKEANHEVYSCWCTAIDRLKAENAALRVAWDAAMAAARGEDRAAQERIFRSWFTIDDAGEE